MRHVSHDQTRPSAAHRTVVAPPCGRGRAAPAAVRCSCGTAVGSSHGDAAPSGSRGSSGNGCSGRDQPLPSDSLDPRASWRTTGTLLYRVSSTTTRVGSTTTRVGSTTTRVGSTTNRVGSTTTRVGSTTTRVGSTTTRVGSTTTRVGSTMTRVGFKCICIMCHFFVLISITV